MLGQTLSPQKALTKERIWKKGNMTGERKVGWLKQSEKLKVTGIQELMIQPFPGKKTPKPLLNCPHI